MIKSGAIRWKLISYQVIIKNLNPLKNDMWKWGKLYFGTCEKQGRGELTEV